MSAAGSALRQHEASREPIPDYISSQAVFHVLCEPQVI